MGGYPMGSKDETRGRGSDDVDSPEFRAALVRAMGECNKMIEGIKWVSYTPSANREWCRATPITTNPLDPRFLDIEMKLQTTPTASDRADETYKKDVTDLIMDARGMPEAQVKEYINSGRAFDDGVLALALWGAKVTQFARNLGRLATVLQSMPDCTAEYHALLTHLFDTEGRSTIITTAGNVGKPVAFDVDMIRHRKSGIVRLVARTAEGSFITAMGFKYCGVDQAQEIMASGATAALDGEPFSKIHVVSMG